MIRFRLTAAVLALLPVPAFAAEDAIVVTAIGAAQDERRTGQSITVLEQAAIEQRQLQTVSDLLSTTSGVTVSRNGGPGQPTAVRIRGAEDAQTLVLIDGVRVNDPSSPGGAFDFGNLLTGNIERIEVLRGPNSVPWGSQAIGGVVNIVTAPPPGELAADLRGEYGYKNSAQVVGEVGDSFGPVAATLGGGYFRDDGVSAFKGGSERDGYLQYAADARIAVTLSDVFSVDLRGYYAHSRVNFDGFPPPLFVFADTNDFAKTRQLVGYVALNAAFGEFHNRIAFTINDINRDSTASFAARGRVERVEYQGDARLAQGLRAVFGLEHEHSRFGDGTSRFSTRIDSAYAQIVADPFEALTLTGGVRIDNHRTYGTKAIFSANAAFRPGAGTVIRASYGEGFKAPTLYQLFSDFGKPMLPNVKPLQPEVARSFDLGVEQSLVDGALKFGATFFHRVTRNQIDFFACFSAPAPLCAPRPFGFYDNIARTRALGVETFVELRPTPKLTFAANYSLIDAKDRATGLALLRRPKHNINASVDWRARDWLKLGASVQTLSDSRDIDFVSFTPTSLDGYTLVGLRASLPIGERLEFYCRIENLTNARYETVSGYGTLGRNAHVGVRVKL